MSSLEAASGEFLQPGRGPGRGGLAAPVFPRVPLSSYYLDELLLDKTVVNLWAGRLMGIWLGRAGSWSFLGEESSFSPHWLVLQQL